MKTTIINKKVVDDIIKKMIDPDELEKMKYEFCECFGFGEIYDLVRYTPVEGFTIAPIYQFVDNCDKIFSEARGGYLSYGMIEYPRKWKVRQISHISRSCFYMEMIWLIKENKIVDHKLRPSLLQKTARDYIKIFKPELPIGIHYFKKRQS